MKRKTSRFLKLTLRYWLPTLGWAGVIFYLSHIPGEELPTWDIPFIDKIVHALEFGVLAVFLLRSFRATFPDKTLPTWRTWTMIAALLYALMDETLQLGVSGRVFSPYDLAADTCGVLFFLFLMKVKK